MRSVNTLPIGPLEFIGYFEEDGEVIARKCKNVFEGSWYVEDENGKPCYCHLIGWNYLIVNGDHLTNSKSE